MALYRLFLFRWAPFVYLATALPAAIFIAYLTPPFQAPDENSHFLRAVQILGGGFVGEIRSPTDSGGSVPANAVVFSEGFDALIGHPEVKVDPSAAAQLRDLPWNVGDRTYATFSNTVILPPVFYLPAVIGLYVARASDFGIYDSYQVARLLTAVTAVGMGALAIRLALRGRGLLFVLLSLPMTLYLFGSVSQDALLIASAALAVGISSRAAGAERPLGAWQRLLVAVLIGAAVAARPSLFPLLGILLTSLVRPREPRSFLGSAFIALTPLCLAAAIAGGWIAFGAAPVRVLVRQDAGVSIAAQIDFLRHHLAVVPAIIRNTLTNAGFAHLKQVIGIFGWSDTPLPAFLYDASFVALAVGIGLTVVEEGASLGFAEGLFILLCWILASAAVYAAFYLSWTSVGAREVDGVQGRYFLSGAMLLALGIPALAFWRRQGAFSVPGNIFSILGWLFIIFFAAVSDWLSIPPVLLARFYL